MRNILKVSALALLLATAACTHRDGRPDYLGNTLLGAGVGAAAGLGGSAIAADQQGQQRRAARRGY